MGKFNWDRCTGGGRRKREAYSGHAPARHESVEWTTMVVSENEGVRVLKLMSGNGAAMEHIVSAKAASPCVSLDPESDEFKAIASRYAASISDR